MPKKSKKSKSKRLSLRQKHKIIRKVKEHHRKKAKELKKAGHKVKKAPKDPGIPSQWPFKEELMKDLAWQRQRILDQEKQKKEDRRAAKVKTIFVCSPLDICAQSSGHVCDVPWEICAQFPGDICVKSPGDILRGG
eukprot:jgi/Botrbrau1/8088/Bobra.0230s0013.1